MTIPRSRADDNFVRVSTVIVFAFVLLAIVNLCSGVALIASSLWLILVTSWSWSACREAGGFYRFLINWLGGLAGRRFIESVPVDAQPRVIRFGFELLGHCFMQKSISLDSIESVEWNTGQATDMADYDRNDWHVWVWFNRNASSRDKKQRTPRKADQDLYGVGPSTRKPLTEALGLSLVAFLRDAGADLVPGTTPTCFVKRYDTGSAESIELPISEARSSLSYLLCYNGPAA